MSMAAFSTAFEISKNNTETLDHPRAMLQFGIVAVAIGIIALIVVITHIGKHGLRLKSLYYVFFPLAWAAFVIPISIQDFNTAKAQINELVSAYTSNQCEISEGPVQVLHEQSRHGHTKGDIVSIGGTKLEINAFHATTAYREIIAHGGVLREGVYARVYHYNGRVLRVDVRKERVN